MRGFNGRRAAAHCPRNDAADECAPRNAHASARATFSSIGLDFGILPAGQRENANGPFGGDVQETRKIAGAFDRYYFETHVPIAKRIPGVRKYEVSRGAVMTPAGMSDFHLIATLHFDDVAAIQRAFASAEGQAAAADVQKFATGGADMLLFDSAEA